MANWPALRRDPVQYMLETNQLVANAQAALHNSTRPYTTFLEELEACIDDFPNTPERDSCRALLRTIMDDLFIAGVSQNVAEITQRTAAIDEQIRRLVEITHKANRSAALVSLQPVIDATHSLTRIIQEISNLQGSPDASIATSAGHLTDEVSALATKLRTVAPVPNVDVDRIRATALALGRIADGLRSIQRDPQTLNTTVGTLVSDLTNVRSSLAAVVSAIT